jgi:small subunit ribosomal protein S17
MNTRRRLVGVVTSNKMMKTVVVRVSRSFRHPLYKKVVHTSHAIKAHDELGCQIGDQVMVVESQPISHTKRWVVESIVKQGELPEVALSDAGE